MAIAQKGAWWREQRTKVGTQALRGVVNAGVRWVAVGDDSGAPLILTVETADAQDLAPAFTARSAAGTDVLNGVAYVAVGVRVAAVGDNGRIEESSNQGQTWTGQNVAGSPDFNDITSNSGDATSRFIAAGVDEIWGQDNLGSWTQRWSGSQTWRSVAYRAGAGYFAAGDGGFGSHSPSGAVGTWTAPFSMSAATVNKVRANNNLFLAASGNLIWKSVTGLSGSWSIASALSGTIQTVFPLATTGFWAAFDTGFGCWLSSDDGSTWVEVPDVPGQILDGFDQNATAYAVGSGGAALVSFGQAQDDYVDPGVETQTVGPAFSPNADMAGDAVRRLVTQFRSGRG